MDAHQVSPVAYEEAAQTLVCHRIVPTYRLYYGTQDGKLCIPLMKSEAFRGTEGFNRNL